MSSTIYTTQHSSPVVTRYSPRIADDTTNHSQRTTNRRSIGDRFRNLFRKNSSSPKRATSNDRSLPPQVTTSSSSIRQGSASPASVRSTAEAPHLQAPTVSWPFGKKKKKSSATSDTPKSSKRKMKKNQTTVSSMEISSPYYQQENQPPIHGQLFTPRTPEFAHGSTGRYQSPSSTYEFDTTKGFRDYTVIDQTPHYQKVVVPDTDVFTPPPYTSDRSRSPSMNRQRLPNTNNDYYFHHDNSTRTHPSSLADIEVISTPQRKRKVGDIPPLNNNQILIEKPPVSPKTSYQQPTSIISNRTQSKYGSSSTLTNTGVYTNTSQPLEAGTPKLNAPSISFGSTSSKKKAKRSKSQSRSDGMTSSSSTISNLVQQNPTKPYPSRSTPMGSLPDAEFVQYSSSSSLQPSKSKTNKYPGITAIVQHHWRPASGYYSQHPTTAISTPTSPRQPQRFETSTTTLNESEPTQSWPRPTGNASVSSTSPLQRHDGYIRPLTPQNPRIHANINIRYIDTDDNKRGRSSPPRSSRFDSSDPPTTYRSSTTIYTRDKQQYVPRGEIRTWSSQENNLNNEHSDLYRKPPYTHVEFDHQNNQKTNQYDQHIIPPKINDNYDEHRYSPRAHEEQLYLAEQKVINDEEIQEEEQYEVTFEYEQHHQQFAYETTTQYNELQSTNRYSNETNGDQNSAYSNRASTAQSTMINERDKIYDQSSRSHTNSDYKQETLNTMSPVDKVTEIPHTYTLKRRNSYDGLGISISADSQTRSNSFIREVEEGSPGDRAGLRKNDRIISVNGIRAENVDFSDVLTLIKQGLDNDHLQLTVIHEPEHN